MPDLDAEIKLKSVSELLLDEEGMPARYWIPAYQRGYRWTETQVVQLLDDIWDFIQNCGNEGSGSFYCLQPLVVCKRSDGSYEVVDGQQRLTTIFILLSYRQDILNIIGKQRYAIDFETRDPSFLADIKLERAGENVDFHHICEAWKAIDAWCRGRDGSHVLKLIQHLLNDDEAGGNVRVIWYELTVEDDPVAAFTRLNVGKIPLTEAELIRALFLRRARLDDATENLSLRIAYEWDQIEKRLQDDPFWYFLQNEDSGGINRIGLIFRLAASLAQKSDGIVLDGQPYSVFFYFSNRLQENSADDEWKRIRSIFMRLEEWYEDRELFHVIGFILQQGGRGNISIITDLLEGGLTSSKLSFSRSLRRRIFKSIFGQSLDDIDANELLQEISEFCEEVTYSNASSKLRGILLLFNLTTLLSDPRSNVRFQFDSFKRERWDIEHIRSVSNSRPDAAHEQDEWLGHCLTYFESIGDNEGGDLADRIKAYLSARGERRQKEPETFEEIDGALLAYFGEDSEEMKHGLGNLTLLDSGTNRSYKNAVFAVKRSTLLGHDKSGIFVPLCTRNVFLKAYSQTVGNPILWSNEDSEAYLKQINETFFRFFETLELQGQ